MPLSNEQRDKLNEELDYLEEKKKNLELKLDRTVQKIHAELSRIDVSSALIKDVLQTETPSEA
jgi:hypothetical protein